MKVIATRTLLFSFAFLISLQNIVDADASRRHLLSRGFRNGASLWTNGRAFPSASVPPTSSNILLSVRGGASEYPGRQSWNAGSKYNYGRTSPNYTSTARNYQAPTYDQSQDATEKEEVKEAFSEAFLQRDNRNRFIARVYAILTGQLLFTAGAIQAIHSNPGVRDFMLLHPKVPLFGLLISTIAYWITLSSENLRHSSLMKWPLLAAFTFGESIAVGFVASVYAYSSVIKAMTITATTTLSVTLYTLLQKNPKYDLSQWGRALAGLGMAFILYGAIHVLSLFGILPHGFLPYSEAIYSMLGAGLFSLYLAYHTRLIVSGKSAKYQMNEKDYILGAMSLYSDIVNIFLHILRILGEIDD